MSNPPGTNRNTWVGKRSVVRASGLGFLLLYNGRLQKQLAGKDAAALGRADAAAAVSAARNEGFPSGAAIFLDQEEGGRLLPEQTAYLFAWIDGVGASPYRAGVYCSGIPVSEGDNKITTAGEILAHEGKKPVVLWVVNDSYPTAPGCLIPKRALVPSQSGVPQAQVWQYARSPRTEFASSGAKGYAGDGQCYALGLAPGPQTFVDLNVSTSPDPSRGR